MLGALLSKGSLSKCRAGSPDWIASRKGEFRGIERGGDYAARASASSALKAKYPRLVAGTHEAISSGNSNRTLPPELGIKRNDCQKYLESG